MTEILRKLTPRQENFVHAYMVSGVASQAYRQYYGTDKMNDDTARRNAHVLLHKDNIQATIKRLKDQKDAKRLEIEDIARKSASQALQTLVSISNDPKAPQSSRVAASCAVLDRAYGKPISKTELDATVNSRSGGVEEQSDADLLRVIEGGKAG